MTGDGSLGLKQVSRSTQIELESVPRVKEFESQLYRFLELERPSVLQELGAEPRTGILDEQFYEGWIGLVELGRQPHEARPFVMVLLVGREGSHGVCQQLFNG